MGAVEKRISPDTHRLVHQESHRFLLTERPAPTSVEARVAEFPVRWYANGVDLAELGAREYQGADIGMRELRRWVEGEYRRETGYEGPLNWTPIRRPHPPEVWRQVDGPAGWYVDLSVLLWRPLPKRERGKLPA